MLVQRQTASRAFAIARLDETSKSYLLVQYVEPKDFAELGDRTLSELSELNHRPRSVEGEIQCYF